MNTFKPDGWPTVTPRVITDDVAGLVGSGTPPSVWGGSKVCRPSTQRASKQRSRTQRAERAVAHSL
jgi:hypothetical protein